MILFAFGVGLANFATGRRMTPRQVVAAIGAALPLVASYGSTGNVALEDGDVEEVRRILDERTSVPWAVVRSDELDHGLRELDLMTDPERMQRPGERPTPGLAFAVTPSRDRELASTSRAELHRVSVETVAVWKHDLLTGAKLDRHRRRGGWGAISADLAHQLGGQWTSRSRRTIDGLRSRIVIPRR